MVVVIVLSVVLWCSIPPVLSRVMARLGYDGTSSRRWSDGTEALAPSSAARTRPARTA